MKNVIVKICIETEIIENDDIESALTINKLNKIKNELKEINIEDKIMGMVLPNETVNNIERLKLNRYFYSDDYDMKFTYYIRLESVNANFDIWPSWKDAVENNFGGYLLIKNEDYTVTFLAFTEYSKNE